MTTIFSRAKTALYNAWQVMFGFINVSISFLLVLVQFSAFEESRRDRSGSWNFNREGIYGLPAYEFKSTDSERFLVGDFVSIACVNDDEYKINVISANDSGETELFYEIQEPHYGDYWRYDNNILQEGKFSLLGNASINTISNAYLKELTSPSINIYELDLKFETEFIRSLNAAGGESLLAFKSRGRIDDFEFGWHKIGTRLSRACNENIKEKLALSEFLKLSVALFIIFLSAFLFYTTRLVSNKVFYGCIILPLLSYAGFQIIFLLPLIYNLF